MGRVMTQIRLKYVHEYRDRRGALRRYVRRPGFPRVALPGVPGSPEFMEAYAAALAGSSIPTKREEPDGTFAALVTRYYASPKFANLSAKSKSIYRRVLESYIPKHGDSAVRLLTVDKAEKLISDIGATRPGLANLHRSILATVFRYAVKIRLRTDNPFSTDAIDPYKLGSHHTWTDDELNAFRKRWPLGTRERLAFVVLLYTSQRISDAVKLKRSDVMPVKQQKTGTELSIPAHQALTRAIKAGPSNGIYIIGNEDGRPMSAAALTQMMARAIKAAVLPDRCVAHGLRKANQRILAEHGATIKMMQAISGHKTLKESERYSQAANQATLAAAAMALMPDEE
jgi:integrase